MTTAATTAPTATHEEFLHRVRDIVIASAIERGTITEDEAAGLAHAKLVYGVGHGYRGICYYDAWENGVGKVAVVEIAASAEESWVQLASTLVHELGHVLAGFGAGHGADWKAAAVRLGFTRQPAAARQVYQQSLLNVNIAEKAARLALIMADGAPGFAAAGIRIPKPRPCSAGVGSKGGRSRGTGSGSRLRLWECGCEKPVKVRVASDDFRAHCDMCGQAFERR